MKHEKSIKNKYTNYSGSDFSQSNEYCCLQVFIIKKTAAATAV